MRHSIAALKYTALYTTIAFTSLIGYTVSVHAGDVYFIGTSPLSPWQNGTSWNTGTPPTENDRAIFGTSSARINISSGNPVAIGSISIPSSSTFNNFSNESMASVIFHGFDGMGALLESALTVAMPRRIELANNLIFRASNEAGGGFNMASLNVAGLWRGLQLHTFDVHIDTVYEANKFNFAPSSPIIGSGNVLKTGKGLLSIASISEFTGKTLVEDGSVALTGSGSLASSSEVRIEGPGTLDIAGLSAGGTDVTNLTGAGRVLLGTKTLNLTNPTGHFAGEISGDGGVMVTGGNTVFVGRNTYTGLTITTAGAGVTLGDGGATGEIAGDVVNDGILSFNRSDDAFIYGGVISGSGEIRQNGSGKISLTGDSSAFAGTTSVAAGSLSVNGILGGTMNVNGGRLEGIGTVGPTTNDAGGTIAPGNSIGTFTVDGDYVGDGGVLEVDAELGDDTSPADLLVVKSSTSGTTGVKIINLNGGGAPTVEGIKIVDVGGASDGVFSLLGDYAVDGKPAFVGGAYAYLLQQNGISTPDDGDWYLRSVLAPEDPQPEQPITPEPPGPPETPGGEATPGQGGTSPTAPAPLYQAGVPLYEAYPGALLSMNEPSRLEQRIRQRRMSDGEITFVGKGGFPISPDDQLSPWARIFTMNGKVRPKASSSATHYDVDRWTLQAGIDVLMTDNDRGRLVGGINMHYGNASTKVFSRHGNGRIDTQAVGAGATFTWYGNNGFYTDTQAQVSLYDTNLLSHTAGKELVHGNGAIGTALSFETGRQLALGSNLSITPQAQLTYSTVKFDDFPDPFNAAVSSERGGSLKARLGVSANYQTAKQTFNGAEATINLYGIANIYREFMPGTKVNVSQVGFESREHKLSGEIGLGASVELADKLSLFGELAVSSDFSRPHDSRKFNGSLGLRIAF